MIASTHDQSYIKEKNECLGENSKFKNNKMKNYNKFASAIYYRCNKKGHITPHCRSKYPVNNNNANMVEDDMEDDAFFAFVGDSDHIENANGMNKKWILDSGSTAHLCNDSKNFVQSSEIKEHLNLASTSMTDIKERNCEIEYKHQ
ncbi:hypothetical protein TKK_0010202 [Trichogramma kaykai]